MLLSQHHEAAESGWLCNIAGKQTWKLPQKVLVVVFVGKRRTLLVKHLTVLLYFHVLHLPRYINSLSNNIGVQNLCCGWYVRVLTWQSTIAASAEGSGLENLTYQLTPVSRSQVTPCCRLHLRWILAPTRLELRCRTRRRWTRGWKGRNFCCKTGFSDLFCNLLLLAETTKRYLIHLRLFWIQKV